MASLIRSAAISTPAPASATWGAARIFRTWLVSTSMPRPVMKPAITARDRKLARNASRKSPEDEEQQAADHGQGEGVLQAQRVPGRGEGDQGGADQPGHGGIRAGHQVARAREQGEHRQRDDGRIEAGHGGQAGHLRVADVERDHQGGQGDARRDLPGDVGQPDAFEPREGPRPADPGEHAGGRVTHGFRLLGASACVFVFAAGAGAGPAHLRYSRRAVRVMGPRTRTYGTTAQTTATISTCPG